MIVRRRTQSKERNSLASSKPAMRRGNLLSLNKVKLSFCDTGPVGMATAGHIRVVYVPGILMIVVSPGKLTSRSVSISFRATHEGSCTVDCIFPFIV